MTKVCVGATIAALFLVTVASLVKFTSASPSAQGSVVASPLSIEELTLRVKELPVMRVDNPI